jgi:hypothetical protein
VWTGSYVGSYVCSLVVRYVVGICVGIISRKKYSSHGGKINQFF